MSRISAIINGQAIQSMRASDFDIPSAIGELIDNSIQANAKNISITINTFTHTPFESKKERELIKEIICIDDGIGMSGEENGILHQCISLGYSSRYNDRNGIGRFGVGMTYAGIRFATKIETYSKVAGGEWHYVTFDLKNEEDINKGINSPIKKIPPKNYLSQISGDHGTIVIWSDFDKLNERDMDSSTYNDMDAHNNKRGKGQYTKMKPEESLGSFGLLNHWIGRTFRKFIWGGISIKLNENPVYAFDPLFLNKDKVQFSDDDCAKILVEDDIEWKGSQIHYIVTLLPEMYREVSSLGGLPFPGRYIYDNEGISIMRADREVFYDHIPRLQADSLNKIKWEDADRWWGCEISFTPELDEYFSVKNIKRGAIPVKDLNEIIYHKLNDVIKQAKKEVSDHWNKKADEKRAEIGDNPHAPAQEIATKTKLPGKVVAGTEKSPEEQKNIIDQLIEGLNEDEKEKQKALFRDQPFTILDDRWRGEVFIEATHVNGNAVLKYNLNHPFMDELSKLRKRIGEDANISTLTTLIDIMLMALIEARGRQSDEAELVVEDLWDDLMSDWGKFLKSYTRSYKLEHPNEDNC